MSTEAIDNLLKNKETTDDPNFVKFFMNFGILTGVIIVFVIIGAIGLYLTKVAESGVLPTNPLGKPYNCTGDDLKTAGDYIKLWWYLRDFITMTHPHIKHTLRIAVDMIFNTIKK